MNDRMLKAVLCIEAGILITLVAIAATLIYIASQR